MNKKKNLSDVFFCWKKQFEAISQILKSKPMIWVKSYVTIQLNITGQHVLDLKESPFNLKMNIFTETTANTQDSVSKSWPLNVVPKRSSSWTTLVSQFVTATPRRGFIRCCRHSDSQRMRKISETALNSMRSEMPATQMKLSVLPVKKEFWLVLQHLTQCRIASLETLKEQFADQIISSGLTNVCPLGADEFQAFNPSGRTTLSTNPA